MEQSNTDFYVLTEHIKDYLGLIGAIKDVLHERVKVTDATYCDSTKQTVNC